ncbi:dCTP deaminase [Stygiolobus caldivivus]|uniref:Deoxycytidine triphosphate deaminase n=1 Tax=Stygiolobus caldivivus TaxID=2824673 RepID=A0A8D5U794_9CREN|nr:deoxycytidine triphosphate deaminase [Stygiolobus caldivivus]BCU70355.1 deoxycytidine triphosphate deaminase [Stygiolobus caldivivus]
MILPHQLIKGLLGSVILNYEQNSVRENGYDLRVCGEYYYEVLGGAELPSKKSEIKSIKFGESAVLDPLKTYLFESCEEFNMPSDLAALLTLKSTMARNGFIAPPTVIDAGYRGKITVAVTSLYKSSIRKNSSTHHVVFMRLEEPTEKTYNGQYQYGKVI